LRFGTRLAGRSSVPIDPRCMGSPRRWARPVSKQRALDRIDRPPGVRRLVSLLRYCAALFRAPSRSPPQVPFRAPAHCQGFGPLRDITSARPRSRGFHDLASFRPQAFAASRRFSPRSGFEACFILEPRPGFVPVQGLLAPRSASALVGRRSPLAVGPPDRSPSFSARRPPPETSATRSCSAWSSVRTGSVMSLADGRSPPRVGLLQVRSTSDEVTASP